jgi:hypothetical protein
MQAQQREAVVQGRSLSPYWLRYKVLLAILFQGDALYSSCFKIPEVEHGSVASRSGCSGAKPTAHTGSGIAIVFLEIPCI